ncbi:alpha/beta fold hydrolase [Solimonas soli]|uniref:alpha/beta fold hydrolase n=1 Tax=Solimonas soli TaxID=413479 RepID=UPI0004878CE0|nr:alpha/beta hydrolase [Solimonas soli]
MPSLRINDYDLAYAEAGSGTPLLMIHGSLCDYRYWHPQMAPFAARRRAIAVSLRHCWPEAWDGGGEGYSIEQHVQDTIAFIDALDAGPVDLLGHSRGGYIAFLVALRAPGRVRRLILAEPGGTPDPTLAPECAGLAPVSSSRLAEAAQRIAAGDIDGGLALFIDGVSGAPLWQHMVGSFKRMARDNARTLLGQVREQRMGFSRAQLRALKTPTLLIGGALSPPPFPQLLDLLHQHIDGSRRVTIAGARHAMNLAAPIPFNAAVLDFLASP